MTEGRIRSNDDASLLGFLGNMGGVGDAYREQAGMARGYAEAARQMAKGVRNLARQSDEDHVTGAPTTDELEALAMRAKRLADKYEELEREHHSIAEHADEVTGVARGSHETDIERVNNPRTSHGAERRADVSAALEDS